MSADTLKLPEIIQGGMGIGLSSWLLARTVSKLGQMGVVSGAGLHVVTARRLQDGDKGGHLERAAAAFPIPEIAKRVWDTYFVSGGKAPDASYKSVPMFSIKPPRALMELSIFAGFSEVFLAKEGHKGSVGINLLEKMQLCNLPSLYGAMLAGVDYVLMGAGIPREIPGALDRLARHALAKLRLDVHGAKPGEEYFAELDPGQFSEQTLPPLKRPNFLAIISSAVLAMSLAKKANGSVEGFIVENFTAGGHNAPPRGAMQLDEDGAPVYGERDTPDIEKIRAVGLPFWLAGSFGRPGKLKEAKALGAAGIQVGTAFALCEESGLEAGLKQQVLQQIADDNVSVFTDPLASPTGFPFKVISVPGTISDEEVYAARKRTCDIGILRHPVRLENGELAYRCASEDEEAYVRKGGSIEETIGRKCLCNGLVSNLGLVQRQKDGSLEKPILTAGDSITDVKQFMTPDRKGYRAAEVIDQLLS